MSNVQTAHKVIAYGGDGVAAGALLGSIFGYLPGVAALAAILWYAIQIYESKTVQRWRRLRRLRQRVKRRAYRTALEGTPPKEG